MQTTLDEIFPIEDQNIVRQGLKKISSHLLSLKYLPDLTLFIETSSRPLFYAINPVFQKIYMKRNRVPAYEYIHTVPSYILAMENLMRRSISEKQYKKELFAIGYTEYNLQQLKDAEIHLTEKIKNIIEKWQLKPNSKILLIDDYATADRTTIRKIKEIFIKVDKMISIETFVFISNYIKEYDDNVIAGIKDPKISNEGVPSDGFVYRKFREEVTGLKRDENTLEIINSPKKSHLLMELLNNKMKEIGEEISNSL